MKSIIKSFILAFSLFIAASSFSYAVVIDGYAYLEGMNDHSGIQLTFKRVAPDTATIFFYADSLGYFSANISEGIYNLTYSKTIYETVTLTGQAYYNDKSLTDVTLKYFGLSGEMSGVLKAGIYYVGADIKIAKGKTLTIEPGTILYFEQNSQFLVEGFLLAVGTQADSIVFDRFEGSNSWKGIYFNGAESSVSIMAFCKVFHSESRGINISFDSPTIRNCNISFNSFSSGNNYGGGISLMRSSSLIKDCLISNNKTGSGFSMGGGIYLAQAVLPRLENLIIRDNEATNGGGVYLYSGSYTMVNSLVVNNKASIGGGLYSAGKLVNVTIAGNTAQSAAGVYAVKSMTNCIVANNNGTGIEFFSDNEFIKNTNVWNNSGGNFVKGAPYLGQNVTVNNNGDSCDAWKNISVDPIFEDAQKGDYRLNHKSRCIDAGTNDSVDTQFDLNGYKRIQGFRTSGIETVDIGACEFDSTKTDIRHYLTPIALNYEIYPNPICSEGYIKYNVFEPNFISIKIYDILGNEISNSVNSFQEAGEYNILLNQDNLTNGVNFITIQAGTKKFIRKVIFISNN